MAKKKNEHEGTIKTTWVYDRNLAKPPTKKELKVIRKRERNSHIICLAERLFVAVYSVVGDFDVAIPETFRLAEKFVDAREEFLKKNA